MLSEEQAIEKLKKIREDTIRANECGLSNNDFKEEIEVYDVVLNLITKQQKENEEKDKQINNAINEVENIRQYFSEDLQPEFIRVLEILKNKKVIDW